MKKLYTLFSVMALALTATTVSAQTELVVNGGFENWTEENPEGFYKVGTTSPIYNDLLFKETTTIHGGSNAARQESLDASGGTQYVEANEWMDVTPNKSYTISYWYLDNSASAKTRIWSSWLNATSGTALTDDAAILRYDNQDDSYSVDSPNWVHKTITLTAPAAAARFRFQVRTYREAVGAGGGSIYYDDFSFIDNTPAATASNDIAGLTMYPNPVTGNVLNITSNSNGAKAVAIFDVLGKQVINTTTVNNTVDVANLNAGIYMVKITEEGKTATRKLVKQ